MKTKFTINNGPTRLHGLRSLLLMSAIIVMPFFVEAADMDEVHQLLKQAHSEMLVINETSDEGERTELLQAHQQTMKTLQHEFSELQAEGKLVGNSTLMADLMLYEIQMLKAMMSDIEAKGQ